MPEATISSITIGIPKYSHLEPETFNSIQALRQTVKGANLFLEQITSSCLPVGRNTLLKKCLENKSEIFVGFDADISFTPEQFLKAVAVFLEVNNFIDVLFCSYEPKGHSDIHCAGKFHEGFSGDVNKNAYVPKSAKGLIYDIDWAGSGFFIIGAETIRELEGELFCSPRITTHEGKSRVIPEDVGACVLLKELGFRIALDADNVMQHHVRPEEHWIKTREDVKRLTLPDHTVAHLINSLMQLPNNADVEVLRSIKLQIEQQNYKHVG